MNNFAWVPEAEQMKKTRLYHLMKKLGIEDYDSFYRESIKNIAWFWDEVAKDMKLNWIVPYRQVLDMKDGIAWARWFVDGKINGKGIMAKAGNIPTGICGQR